MIARPAISTLVSPTSGGNATRSNGVTITWTGGSANLQIELDGCADSACDNGAAAICVAPASAGSFNIPSYVLEALPASTNAGVVLSSYSEGSFTATGPMPGLSRPTTTIPVSVTAGARAALH
jgi:hypothetical protein